MPLCNLLLVEKDAESVDYRVYISEQLSRKLIFLLGNEGNLVSLDILSIQF